MANLRYNPLLATATPIWQVYHQVYHETIEFDWPTADAIVDVPLVGSTVRADPINDWNIGLVATEVVVSIAVDNIGSGTQVQVVVRDSDANDLADSTFTVTSGLNTLHTPMLVEGDIAYALVFASTLNGTLTRITAVSGASPQPFTLWNPGVFF
jgi:hypothetical protein